MTERSIIQYGSIWQTIFRTCVSVFFGGLFYAIWLVTFLLTKPDGSFTKALLWLMAPVLTGVGFAVGIFAFDRSIKVRHEAFLRILAWPLVGCVLGAAAVYWYGPMLIVFSMMAMGTLGVILSDVLARK